MIPLAMSLFLMLTGIANMFATTFEVMNREEGFTVFKEERQGEACFKVYF